MKLDPQTSLIAGAEYQSQIINSLALGTGSSQEILHANEGDDCVAGAVAPEEEKEILCRYLAANFVRRDGKFYRVSMPNSALSLSDLKRVALHLVRRDFPHMALTKDIWRKVIQHAVENVHDDQEQTIAVWDSSVVCRPDVASQLVVSDGTARINSFRAPAYRSLGSAVADMTMLEVLLERIFVQASDRTMFLDWLAYVLQNESDKPTWSILLYSRSKGTGKSTLCRLLRQLIGEENSISLNGISKLTGRFNRTVMTRKLITCEEVKLKPGTDQGNTVKALISEKEVAVEGKGKEVEEIEQLCVFVFTTNHHPHWIEEDDRRFLVVDCDHSGHASGPDVEAFQALMAEFHAWMKEPLNLARLRNALLARKVSNSFNPKALNVAAIDTPIMQQLRATSGEVLQDALEELLLERELFAISQRSLIRIFADEFGANQNRIRHLMEGLRWYSTKVKFGGADYVRTVWVHPEYQVARGRVVGPSGYDEAFEPQVEVEIIE